MIDIENKVYTPIAKALREKFPGISVNSSYVNSPPSFPHVSIVEQDNYTVHLDTSDKERFASVMYQVDVYSNSQSKKKEECRTIIGFIDEMLYSMNFTRISMTPVPNMENASIYRLSARYKAETDGNSIFRK